MEKERISKAIQSSRDFAGKKLEEVLEIPVGNLNGFGKTIIFPKKKNYGLADVCLSTGAGTKSIRRQVQLLIAPGEPNSARFASSEKVSLTEQEFIQAILGISPRISLPLELLRPKKQQVVLPDRKKIYVSAGNEKEILGIILKSEKYIVHVHNFTEAGFTLKQVGSYLQRIREDLLKHDWIIVSNKKESTYELRRRETPVMHPAPEDNNENPPLSLLPNPKLLSAGKGLKKEEPEMTERRMHEFKIDLARTILSYLCNKPVGKLGRNVYELVKPLIDNYKLDFVYLGKKSAEKEVKKSAIDFVVNILREIITEAYTKFDYEGLLALSEKEKQVLQYYGCLTQAGCSLGEITNKIVCHLSS